MLTVICNEPGSLTAVESEKPLRKPGEILIRIKRVGVCGTDLHIFTGNQPYLEYPRVMGHEFSGVVEETDNASELNIGDVVYVMPYLSCGTCIACRQGKTNCCTRIQVLGVHCDGAFTEYLSIPHEFVHKAMGVSLDQAAMIEFLSIGAHAVRRSNVQADKRVLVVGTGPIGMAAAIFASLRGANVTVLDTRDDRLAFCKQHLKIHAAVKIGEADKEKLAELTDGDFFDVVFDATGNARAMERGFEFIAHGGTYVMISVVRDSITFSDPEFHKREATLMGSRNATQEDFRHVEECLRNGLIPEAALNTHRLTLSDVPSSFTTLLDPKQGVVKAIIEC
ncbi:MULTISPECIES: zinc-binding alcohol dehydrogenase family protein [Pseudomonas]|uniref:Zinc-binding alcohol dehydrogenase family protein n=1 Tax=Pseudomonas petroselini TaxID=2899822 RepID=A0ABS8QY29_9PSED|nr:MULTISPECIES: zinc-binding alcohol dehydrogenase family protein [Pseudomonas]MCD7040069.1 zinc-binding alcohol dehydrogenase family protein [Pseudomonas petroselini]MCD7046210.1 zinc-binding alcohol dehydrogenase family protein [Pseudomonas petroselini]MCD7067653.1 zinc-binding alcohol dehydrogenase family protein [Pseudomonas petroselini]MCD7078853.1 zinc-binding alcohol dehydrogenase family protein [Pseudomonas petroselini]MCM2379684.1 zinc-binding alcohol dehydrogenase family protein [Ps